jgi:FkbM family methyltransferase
MNLDLTDPLDQAFYLGYYERGLIAIADAVVSPGSTCVDVGAQKGFVTLRLAQRVGAQGLVLAFEPDFRAYSHLEANRRHNAVTNVQLHPTALGAETSSMRLFLNRQLGNTSAFPNEYAERTIEGTADVPVRRFDDLYRASELDHPPISFVKIDAEGAEALVLSGMSETLRMERPVVAIEFNHRSLACAGTSSIEVAGFLRRLGYSLFSYDLVRRGFRRRLVITPYDEQKPLSAHMDDVVCAIPNSPGWRILQRHSVATGKQGR